jgi:uncharacterized protein YkwD
MARGSVVVIVAVVAALIGAGSAAAAPMIVNRGGSVQRASVVQRVPTLEERLIAGINDLRQTNGLSQLRVNTELASVAQEHSMSMAEDGYFEHTGPTGSPFWYRIESKYPSNKRHYWSVGENLAWASPDLSARAVLNMWLKSAEHRKNLLRPGWREIGVGGVHAHPGVGVYEGLDVTIVTADFGVRR